MMSVVTVVARAALPYRLSISVEVCDGSDVYNSGRQYVLSATTARTTLKPGPISLRKVNKGGDSPAAIDVCP